MKDRISAFMDGELDDTAAEHVIDALGRNREALEAWRAYHVISDALREGRMLSEGFSARVAAQLAKEPTVLAPQRLSSPQPRTWYALAASVAAVALVAWLGFGPQEPTIAPVAQAPVVAPVSVAIKPVIDAKPAVIPLPSGTNDYLLAHQGFSPRLSLQGMAPYVRTVSEQTAEARK